jgi:quaternary ammonium compound-resistance protein SugE
MPWLYLLIAGSFEVAWAVGLKYTHGWSRLWPSVGTGVALVASFVLLSLALRSIPLGTAYAVWTGIGVAGTALIGMLFLGEPRDAARLVCLLLVIAGTVGLRVFSRGAAG